MSPNDAALEKLLPKWEAELERANLRPFDPDETEEVDSDREFLSGTLNVEFLVQRPFTEDTEAPNGSSVAFLAEFRNRRILLGADAQSRRPADKQDAHLGGGVPVDVELDQQIGANHSLADLIGRERGVGVEDEGLIVSDAGIGIDLRHLNLVTCGEVINAIAADGRAF